MPILDVLEDQRCRTPGISSKQNLVRKSVMRRLSLILASLLWLGLVGLLGYEVIQKSPATPIGPLPGHVLAGRADRAIHYRATTGIKPVDRVLHEGQEALCYYRLLILG